MRSLAFAKPNVRGRLIACQAAGDRVRAGPIRSLIGIIQTRRRAGLTGESLERSAVMLGTQARRGTTVHWFGWRE